MWKQIKQHPFIFVGMIVVSFALIAFSIGVIYFGWGWTGFTGEMSKVTISNTSKGTTTSTELQPTKTLWDWLGLLGVLAIPVVVGFGAAWFTAQQGKVSDRENTDNQRETALQTYIDKISELLLHEHLGELLSNHQVETIARARTATVLRILDPVRRGSLIRFLSQGGILTKCIEDDLIGIDLRGANLTRVNLERVQLRKANLRNAILNFSDLRNAILGEANLSNADLIGAKLNGADLSDANLSNANLAISDLSDANLSNAKFRGGHYLYKANLSGATLKGATGVTIKEVKKYAESLKGATMPDGTIHP